MTVVVNQEIKEFYDDIAFPGNYQLDEITSNDNIDTNLYLRFIDRFLTDNQSVLDAGCGSGLISNLFAVRYSNQLVSLDFSNSINIGKSFAKFHNINNITWQQCDLVSFDTDCRFDVVICQGVLHHIPNYAVVLNQLKAMIKPGGILLLGVYHPLGKLVQKFVSWGESDRLLQKDQCNNPYETSFFSKQVLKMCHDMKFLDATPGGTNRYAIDFLSLFNAKNGGLTMYAFEKQHD